MPGKTLKGGQLKTVVEKKSLGQFFFDQCEKHRDRVCQINGVTGEKETFGSVQLRGIRLAIELIKRGITTEDHVILCSSNTLDSVIPYLGGAFAGAKIGSLDPTLSVRDTAHLTGIVEPKIIFVEEASVNLIEESLSGLKHLQVEVIVLGNSKKYATLNGLTGPKPEESAFKPVKTDPLDTGIIFFSSGTTGMPKVICISHYSVIRQSLMLCEGNIKPDAVLHFTTTYWVSAIYMTIQSYYTGGYRVMIPQVGSERLPQLALEVIEKYKVNACFISPTLLYSLLTVKNRDKYDTSSLQTVLVGGSAVSLPKLLEAKQFLKHSSVAQCYGQTEVGFIAWFDPIRDRDFVQQKPASSGRLTPGFTLEIRDPETGLALGPNQKGEPCIKADFLMNGYLKMDASSNYTEDGFLRTGDIAYYDEDECLYVVDRIKEMFKYKSWHIVPSSVEAVLLQHSGIKEAVVFGTPHEIDGDLPTACVVLQKNSNVSEEEILRFVNDKVLDREKLRGGVRIVDSLPRTPTGKLSRNKIRESVIKSL